MKNRMKQFFSRSLCVSLIMLLTLMMFSNHSNVNAENTESTSHSYTLSEEIAKISYTDEEKTASGWNGTSRDANKQALFEVAFAKSNLKYYAGAGNNADGSLASSWAVKEYYDWADDGNSWKWSYSSINGLSVGNNAGNEFGFNFVEGKYTVSAMSYSNFWAISWTAPADGIVTLPATALTIDTVTNATLKMAVTKGNYLLPNESGWTEYPESTTIAKQEFEVTKGDVIYINMYADGTASGRKVKIAYDPSFNFIKVEKTTLSSEIAKVSYTDEEKYDNLHQYSKNKIHCFHRADAHDGIKTNNRGRKKYYGQASKRWKASDLRKVVALEEQLL